MTRKFNPTPDWNVFRRGERIVVVPHAPLLIRLRKVIEEDYFDQPVLAPLKSFMNTIFVAGPSCVLIAYYMERWSGLMAWVGIVCLAVASLYWFAPYLLCRLYLARRGYGVAGTVAAANYEAALAKAGEAA